MNPAVIVALALAAQGAGWTEIHRTDELVVYSRPHAGTRVNEMRAVGVVDADPEALWALVSDLEGQTRLLPDTTVSKTLRHDGDAAIVLQRSEPRVLDPREYVIAVREQHEALAGGGTRHTLSWHTDPRYASYVDADAVRIDVNEGFWAVEPLPNGRARITFQLLIDPAGYVPAGLVNMSQTTGAQQALAVLTAAARR